MFLSLINNPKLSYNLSLTLRQQIFPNFNLNNLLNLLPSELIEEIASNLDIEDLVNLCQLNSKYQYLCSDSYIINKVKIENLNTYYNKFPILEIILKYRKDITEIQLNDLFIWASKDGHLEIVKLLLADERVNPAYRDNYAIRWASDHGHVEVVHLLLADKRVNPADQNNYAIRWASRNGHLEIVKLLLADSRVNPTDYVNYAIKRANNNKHLELVNLLLANSRVNPKHLIYEEFFR